MYFYKTQHLNESVTIGHRQLGEESYVLVFKNEQEHVVLHSVSDNIIRMTDTLDSELGLAHRAPPHRLWALGGGGSIVSILPQDSAKSAK